MDKIDVLSQTPLFREFSRAGLQAIADICLTRHLKKRDVLFSEGDKGLSIYILVVGSIKLFKTGPEGREIVIKLIKPGELFAEAVLFEKDSYPVNAVALKTGTVYLIPKHQFVCLLENARFRHEFLGMMLKKVRYLTNQISYLSSYDVEERFFLFLEEQYGRERTIIPAISKKEIAAAIRATPETFSRLLLRLKAEGKLTWAGSQIKISPQAWQSVV